MTDFPVGAKVVLNDPLQPWDGATATMLEQTKMQRDTHTRLVRLDTPLIINGASYYNISVPEKAVRVVPVPNRLALEGQGVPVVAKVTLVAHYNVNPEFYGTKGGAETVAAELEMLRRSPGDILNMPNLSFEVVSGAQIPPALPTDRPEMEA